MEGIGKFSTFAMVKFEFSPCHVLPTQTSF